MVSTTAGRLHSWKTRSCPYQTAIALLVLALANSAAQAGVTTIFLDDFEAQAVGSNPNVPLVGPSWQVDEPAPESVSVVADAANPSNKVLQLGRYWSTATIAFSPEHQALMATNRNMKLEFQYQSVSAGGYVPILDIKGLSGDSGNLAFVYRIMPKPTEDAGSLHDVFYLSPTTGTLADTGLNISSDMLQTLVISNDLANGTSQLTVGADTAMLPLFTCPSMLQGVQFSNYMIGSGGVATYANLDNVTATTHAPEPTTISLAIAGWLLFLAGWSWRLKRRKG